MDLYLRIICSINPINFKKNINLINFIERKENNHFFFFNFLGANRVLINSIVRVFYKSTTDYI